MIRPSKDMKYFAKEVAETVESLVFPPSNLYEVVVSDTIADRAGQKRYISVYFQYPDKRRHLSSYITGNIGEINIVIDIDLLKNPTDLERRFFYHYIRQAVLHELVHIFDPRIEDHSSQQYYLKPGEIPAWICSISELWTYARFELELASTNDCISEILGRIRDSIEDPFYFSEIVRQETSWKPWGQLYDVRPEFGSMLLPPREYLEINNIREELIRSLKENYREIEKEVEKELERSN